MNPDTLTTTDINNKKTFQVPQMDTTASNAALTGLVANQSALGQAYTQAQQEAQKSAEKAKAGTDELSSLLEQYGGMSAETKKSEQEQGLPTLNKELQDLFNLQTQQTAQYLKGITTIEGKPISMEARSAGETALQRQHGIDALLTSAQIQAKQGNIASAQDIVDRAITAKYEPIRQKILTKQFLLQQINTKASKDAENANNLLLKTLDAQEKNDQEIQKMIVDAAPNAPANIISNARFIAQRGGSKLEVSQALGKYGGDYLGDAVKRSTIAKNEADIRKTNAEINKINSDISKGNINIDTTRLPNTPHGFAQKLMSTANKDKNLESTERTQLSKMTMVIGQLDSLQKNLEKNNKTGFFKGRVNQLLGDLNLDKDITTINAQIQALIPNVARGVYGEVGVLTDNDIKNYKKTVTNLTNSKDQNDAVLALTLKNAMKSYEATLNTAANSGINVSGWTNDYLAMAKKVYEIEDRIGVSKTAVNNLVKEDPRLAPVVKELIQAGLTDGEILDNLNAR